eukprot:14887145-Heterocapsa_arctica.AAC.1
MSFIATPGIPTGCEPRGRELVRLRYSMPSCELAYTTGSVSTLNPHWKVQEHRARRSAEIHL